MTTPDYLKQVVVSTQTRRRPVAAEKIGNLFQRPSVSLMLSAGLDFICALARVLSPSGYGLIRLWSPPATLYCAIWKPQRL